MSFVREVLSAAERVEIENIHKNVPHILIKIEEYKQDVMNYIESVYIKYLERPRHNEILLNRATELSENMIQLETIVRDVLQNETGDCILKLSSYKDELLDTKCALKISSQLIEIHEILTNISSFQGEHEYVQMMIEFNKISEYVHVLNREGHIDALDELALNISTAQFTLINKLTNIFRDNVELNENLPVALIIKKRNTEMEQVLQAFALYKSNIKPLDNVTKFLWTCVLNPIVTNKSKVEISENNDSCMMSISVLNNEDKNFYKDVFLNLIRVLDFLKMHFKYPLREEVSTLSYIGNDIRDNLSELLIKQCLNSTIPSTSAELKMYNVVIKDCEELQNKLVECEIFNSDMSSILDHANNVDVHFVNKKCQEYLSSAVTIMKKDLHDMVEVGVPHDTNNPLLESLETFPQCCVSKSCIELIQLINKIIEITIASSDICAGRLYCALQNILHMYGNIVQEHHQKLLKTIPQQVSLFHNNCMYLAHVLMDWSDICVEKFPVALYTETNTFKDKAHLLKSIGNSVFINCIQQQTKQIEEILNESGLISILTLDKVEPITEKCMRQCLRQQELLKTVWHKVLSYLDYNRSIGYILNFMCDYIINAVIKVDDISAEAAEQLVDIFKVILTRGPKLFSDTKEIHLFVESWYKMNELVFVLNSSLIDIDDRWADGKGLLALHFQPEDLKKLIRALFQNTDRRAAVLEKIVM